MLDRVRASGLTDGLSFAFRQLSQGGGGKKIAERVEVELKERVWHRAQRTRAREEGAEEFVRGAQFAARRRRASTCGRAPT